MGKHTQRKKVWSRKETLGLIKCYAARKNEFLHLKNRELAYENVLKDMISQSLTYSSTPVTAIVDRMCKLCIEYKWAKSTNRPSAYMSELDELFGDKPIVPTVTEVLEDIKLEEVSQSEEEMSDTQLDIQFLQKETAGNSKRKRKHWSREETLGLIKCYASRKNEFLHSKKRKAAYSNVLKDMISQNLTDSSTTVAAVEDKMYNLRNAYRLAKDDNSTVPYMSELEELFGDVATAPTAHTLHIGRGPTKGLNDLKHELPQFDETHHSEEGTSDIPSSAQPLLFAKNRKEKTKKHELSQFDEAHHSEEGTSEVNGKEMTEHNTRKRKKWSREETMGLIKCYAVRKNEFQYSRKKILAYANVLKDMISQNLIDPRTTVAALVIRMNSLFRAYRAAKNNNRTTPYMHELEQLFGEKLIGYARTMRVGEGPTNDLNHHPPHIDEVCCSEEEGEASTVAASTYSTSSVFTPMSSSHQSFNDKRLEIMRDEVKAKLAQRAEFFKEMKAVFEERFRKDDEQRREVEQKRLEVLEKFLEKESIKKESIDIEIIKTEYN